MMQYEESHSTTLVFFKGGMNPHSLHILYNQTKEWGFEWNGHSIPSSIPPTKHHLNEIVAICPLFCTLNLETVIWYISNWCSFIAYHLAQVLVVANPANTNALILKEYAPSIPEKNITCLTRLDHNRALGQISERLNVHVGDVKNVIIWGNHSSTQYPDVNHATVTTSSGEKGVRELVADDNWYLKSL